MATSGSILGNPVIRLEDPRILRGDAKYVDDLPMPGTAHLVFVRSTIAHARIESIDTADAKAMPGVVAVYTSDDLELPDVQGFIMLPPAFNRPALAKGRVRFVGDIVAAVVAETRAQAVQAALNQLPADAQHLESDVGNLTAHLLGQDKNRVCHSLLLS